MAELQKVLKVRKDQYNTLASGGTISGYTGLDDNYIYLIPNSTYDFPEVTLTKLIGFTASEIEQFIHGCVITADPNGVLDNYYIQTPVVLYPACSGYSGEYSGAMTHGNQDEQGDLAILNTYSFEFKSNNTYDLNFGIETLAIRGLSSINGHQVGTQATYSLDSSTATLTITTH